MRSTGKNEEILEHCEQMATTLNFKQKQSLQRMKYNSGLEHSFKKCVYSKITINTSTILAHRKKTNIMTLILYRIILNIIIIKEGKIVY